MVFNYEHGRVPEFGWQKGEDFQASSAGEHMANRGRILIADDEKSFLKFSAKLLKKEGYQCDTAKDGPAAVGFLRENRYDVVISDIRMPGNTGLRLAQEVGSLQAGVPVVIVTGYPSLDTAKRAVGLPVVAYIEKPVEFNVLLSSVKSAILQGRSWQKGTDGHKCRIDRCEKLNVIVEEIDGAVSALETTRKSFRSRTIGRVRTRLEAVAKRHKRNKN
jgi:DNA-binding NtrC family response regulator